MGMRKRWSRRITIDGVEYRYHVAPDRDGQALSICVQQVEPAGQRLLTGFMRPSKMTHVAPGSWWGEPVPHAVTPSVIRKLIEAALERDWKPKQTNLPAFVLQAWTIVPELPKPTKESPESD